MERLAELCHLPGHVNISHCHVLVPDSFLMGKCMMIMLLEITAALCFFLSLDLILNLLNEAHSRLVKLNFARVGHAFILDATYVHVDAKRPRTTSVLISSLCTFI